MGVITCIEICVYMNCVFSENIVTEIVLASMRFVFPSCSLTFFTIKSMDMNL